jgi:hypothetical protein
MQQKYLLVSDFAKAVQSDADLANMLKADPVGTVNSIAQPQVPDTWVYRMVIGILGIAVVGGIAAGIGGAAHADLVIPLGSTALGALAGLLAPSPAR